MVQGLVEQAIGWRSLKEDSWQPSAFEMCVATTQARFDEELGPETSMYALALEGAADPTRGGAYRSRRGHADCAGGEIGASGGSAVPKLKPTAARSRRPGRPHRGHCSIHLLLQPCPPLRVEFREP